MPIRKERAIHSGVHFVKTRYSIWIKIRSSGLQKMPTMGSFYDDLVFIRGNSWAC
jgi:hypothetical protein